MVQIGLLGAGGIGKVHAGAYRQIEGANLVAVADINRQAADDLAVQVGARAYYDMNTLFDDPQIDAVDICLPTYLHPQAVIAAAAHGKHVVCEKPIALTLDLVDQMIEAVTRAGVYSMIAQVVRFWPEYLAIRKILEEGKIGKPQAMMASRRSSPPHWGSWFAQPTLSGGTLFDLEIHDLDFAYYLFGKPAGVYGMEVKSANGSWSQIFTSLDYGDKKVLVESSQLMPEGYPFDVACKVVGSDGYVDYRYFGGQVDERSSATTGLWLYQPGQAPQRPELPTMDSYAAELDYFVRCVNANKAPEIATFKQAREVLEMVLAIRHSCETGSVVKL